VNHVTVLGSRPWGDVRKDNLSSLNLGLRGHLQIDLHGSTRRLRPGSQFGRGLCDVVFRIHAPGGQSGNGDHRGRKDRHCNLERSEILSTSRSNHPFFCERHLPFATSAVVLLIWFGPQPEPRLFNERQPPAPQKTHPQRLALAASIVQQETAHRPHRSDPRPAPPSNRSAVPTIAVSVRSHR